MFTTLQTDIDGHESHKIGITKMTLNLGLNNFKQVTLTKLAYLINI
jgi:hypothetical protein